MIDRVKRGEIYLAEIDGRGSEQKGYFPVIIMQNDVGNMVSTTTIVVYMSKKKTLFTYTRNRSRRRKIIYSNVRAHKDYQ